MSYSWNICSVGGVQLAFIVIYPQTKCLYTSSCKTDIHRDWNLQELNVQLAILSGVENLKKHIQFHYAGNEIDKEKKNRTITIWKT